jgi:hypothetical protein
VSRAARRTHRRPTRSPARARGSPVAITLADVDWLAAFGILAGLILLLVWTRRRWGQPRLHVRGAAALWLLAGILAAIIIWLALD